MKKTVKRISRALPALLLALVLAACGGAEAVDPATCTFDEMAAYLTEKGYISKDAAPVDMLTTEGGIPPRPLRHTPTVSRILP